MINNIPPIPPYLQNQYNLLQQQDGVDPLSGRQVTQPMQAQGQPSPYQSNATQSMGTPSLQGQAFHNPQQLQPQQQQPYLSPNPVAQPQPPAQVINPQSRMQGAQNVYQHMQQQQPGQLEHHGYPGGNGQQPAPIQGNPQFPHQQWIDQPGGGTPPGQQAQQYSGQPAPMPQPPQAQAPAPGQAQGPGYPGQPQGVPTAPVAQYQAQPPAQAVIPNQPVINTSQDEIARINQRLAETQNQLNDVGNIRTEVSQAIQAERAQLQGTLDGINNALAQQQNAQRQAAVQAARARLGENLTPEALSSLDEYINNMIGPQVNQQTQQLQQQYETRINELQSQVQSAQQSSQQVQEQVQRTRHNDFMTQLRRDHMDIDQYMAGSNNQGWASYLLQPVAPGSTITRQDELDLAAKSGDSSRVSQMVSDYKLNSGQYYPQQNNGMYAPNGNGNGQTYNAYPNGNGAYQVDPQQMNPAPYQQHPTMTQTPDPGMGQPYVNPYQQVNSINQIPVAPYVSPTGHQPVGNGGFVNQPSQYQSFTQADLVQAGQELTKQSGPGGNPQQREYWSNRVNQIEQFFMNQAGASQSILPPIY